MSGPQVFLFRRSLYSDLKEDSEPLDSACAEFLSVNLVFCNAVLNQFRSSELHEGNRTADAVVSALRNQALEEVFGRTAVFGSLEHFERNVAFLNDESEFFAERDSFFILANVNERDLASRIFLHGFFEHCEERSDTDTGGEQAEFAVAFGQVEFADREGNFNDITFVDVVVQSVGPAGDFSTASTFLTAIVREVASALTTVY